jgi:hypothetical protein
MADRKIQVKVSELAQLFQEASERARARGELKAFLIEKGFSANVAEYVTTKWGAYTANDLQYLTLQDLDDLKKKSNDRDLPEEEYQKLIEFITLARQYFDAPRAAQSASCGGAANQYFVAFTANRRV